MLTLSQKIERYLLPNAAKPAQYIGDEYNIIIKDWDAAGLKMAFCFPDTYEIGMSYLGLRILYHVMNRRDGFLFERVFMPQPDAIDIMAEHDIPPFSLESKHTLTDFDVVGFTLQHEMSYTNVLLMLKMAGIPLRAADRDDSFPLIIAGGACSFNPEPLAPFFDLFNLGDGEEVLPELCELWEKMKPLGKAAYLREACKIPGVYVPSFYTPQFADGRLSGIEVANGAPQVVYKRVVADMDTAEFPERDLVPYLQIVHDRAVLEVMRGCNRGCRFCQAGVICRPVREKSPEVLLEQADKLLRNSGYDEIGMISLSTADYSCVGEVIDGLMERYAKNGVRVSLPSLRADAFSIDLAQKVQQVRKSGLTFAPEAGTQRLRDVINKGVTEEDIITAVTSAFRAGWSGVKLYFMIGLPTETEEDLDGIYDIAQKVVRAYKSIPPEERARGLNISVSASIFVPKPHTPFQWYPQCSKEEIAAKVAYLRNKFRTLKQVRLSCHDGPTSFLEGAFARGDRRLADVLERAVELGCRNDSWREQFRFDLWQQAFEEFGLSAEQFAYQQFNYDDILPWDSVSCGVSKKWLWNEWQKAHRAETTADCCWDKCSGCGVCKRLGISNDLCKDTEAKEVIEL